MHVCKPKPILVNDLDAPINLHAIGDIHVGEAGCAMRLAAEKINAVAEDNSGIVLLMGDLGGFIASKDRRFDPSEIAPDLQIQDLNDWGSAIVKRIHTLLYPIKHKVIGSIEGNHEMTWRHSGHGNVAEWIANGLGCPLLGYSALGSLEFMCGKHKRTLDFYATHGAGNAVTIGAKVNRLVRAMNDFPFVDLTMIAHVHVSVGYELPRLRLVKGRIVEHTQTGVITGSYTRSYAEGHSGYAERAGMPPSALGHRIVKIVPNKGVVGTKRA